MGSLVGGESASPSDPLPATALYLSNKEIKCKKEKFLKDRSRHFTKENTGVAQQTQEKASGITSRPGNVKTAGTPG